ncbi:MAG TPA: HK97 family phage prohead protease [Streptosporangiaceae bacterium]
MPWKVEKGHGCPASRPWAVVKQTDGTVEGCHPTKDAAIQQQKALYAKEPKMNAASADCGCGGRDHQVGTRANVDNSSWDAQAAMGRCSNSATPASCFGSICAARVSANPADTQAGWALPHHKNSGGPPNAKGVSSALGYLDRTQGIDKAAARRHLEAHQASINAGQSNSADPPRDNLFRALTRADGAYELREDAEGGMPTLLLRWAVFNEWTEINSFFEGRFLERNHPKSMDQTIAKDRDAMRVLFQHGRDPQAADKPLGPIEQLEAQRKTTYAEVPLLDTSYNRDLLPGLRAGLYGASYRFQVEEENWVKKPERSDYNPEGLPERTIMQARVLEFGPVTFPAYAGATAGVRSLTDRFLGFEDFTGRLGARSAGGGDPDTELGNGDVSAIQEALHVRDRAWRLRRRLTNA